MIICQGNPGHWICGLKLKIFKYIFLLVIGSGATQLQADIFSHDYHRQSGVIDTPTPAAYSVCFNHSCTSIETRSLTEQQWKRVTAPLQTAAVSAEEERHAIAAAIAIMEQIVGPQTGTHQDLGRNLPGFGRSGQMDCIDESTNTNTYLTMLEATGLLKWHTRVNRSTRFGIFAGMPHTTAITMETGAGTRYSVDSWFFDNGLPPAVVELSAWKKGWNPGDTVE